MTGPLELSIDDAVSIATRLFRTGRLDEARALYERGIELIRRAAERAPDHPDLFNNLGIVFRKRNDEDSAIASFRKAIECEPRLFDAYDNLLRLLVARGEAKAALALATRWNELTDNDPLARHALAALSGEHPQDRCPDEYLVRTFDGSSRDFDAVLASLQYAGPELLQSALDDLALEPASSDVLDGGCGTGLCAAVLRPIARRLTGVDLSSGMLDRARTRGGYDALIRAELTAYLLANPDAFDVVACMDTLNYFGDLLPVLAAARGSLRNGGVLVFTLEHASAADAPAGFDLQKHGRYRHSRGYLESAVAASGLHVRSAAETVLRLDRGQPVPAVLVTLTK